MNIYESIAAIMREGYAIGKDKRNPQQGFMYRGIDDVMNTFQPLLASHGVFVIPEVIEHTREDRTTKSGSPLIYSIMKIRYTFYASDGSSVSAEVIGEGMDSADKSSNKAMAVGMKYAMFQTFCIPTEEMRLDDPDGYVPEESRKTPKAPKEQKESPPKPLKKLEAPKEEAKPKDDTICEDCGEKIVGISDNWTAEKLIAYSKSVCNGHVYCNKCAGKHKTT